MTVARPRSGLSQRSISSSLTAASDECQEAVEILSLSCVATTAAPARLPMTLVIVPNMSGMRSSPMSSVSPASGSPVALNADARLTMLADGTLATVSEARNTAAPAWNNSPVPSGTPYRWAANTIATAWNNALPERLMLAPSGSTKLVTVREILSSSSAAASIVGRVASDDVVENAIASDGQETFRNLATRIRATSAIAGSSTPAMNTASPAITASTNTAMVFTSDNPN